MADLLAFTGILMTHIAYMRFHYCSYLSSQASLIESHRRKLHIDVLTSLQDRHRVIDKEQDVNSAATYAEMDKMLLIRVHYRKTFIMFEGLFADFIVTFHWSRFSKLLVMIYTSPVGSSLSLCIGSVAACLLSYLQIAITLVFQLCMNAIFDSGFAPHFELVCFCLCMFVVVVSRWLFIGNHNDNSSRDHLCSHSSYL